MNKGYQSQCEETNRMIYAMNTKGKEKKGKNNYLKGTMQRTWKFPITTKEPYKEKAYMARYLQTKHIFSF